MRKLLTSTSLYTILFINAVNVYAASTKTDITLDNPLGSGTTFRSLAGDIFSSLSKILMVVVPIIIVVGAFQMMFASGDPEKFKKGQKTVVYSVIGLVILLLAQGIVAIVERVFTTGV